MSKKIYSILKGAVTGAISGIASTSPNFMIMHIGEEPENNISAPSGAIAYLEDKVEKWIYKYIKVGANATSWEKEACLVESTNLSIARPKNVVVFNPESNLFYKSTSSLRPEYCVLGTPGLGKFKAHNQVISSWTKGHGIKVKPEKISIELYPSQKNNTIHSMIPMKMDNINITAKVNIERLNQSGFIFCGLSISEDSNNAMMFGLNINANNLTLATIKQLEPDSEPIVLSGKFIPLMSSFYIRMHIDDKLHCLYSADGKSWIKVFSCNINPTNFESLGLCGFNYSSEEVAKFNCDLLLVTKSSDCYEKIAEGI